MKSAPREGRGKFSEGAAYFRFGLQTFAHAPIKLKQESWLEVKMNKTHSVLHFLCAVVMLWFCSISFAYAGTTQGTVVGLRDSGENNWELVIKDSHGKKIGFSINSYDAYQQWNDKANKGKKVSITWSEEGSGKDAFKTFSKIDVLETGQTTAPPSNHKSVKILKISDFSEGADSVTTDKGEYILQTYNKNYKKISKKLKNSIGKTVTLILDADGDGLISDIK